MASHEVIPVNEATAPALLERFGEFGDAVVRRAVIDVVARTADIELDAMDAGDEGAWKRAHFVFRGLEEWRFARIRAATEIVFQASIHTHGDLMLIDFQGTHDLPLVLSEDDLGHVRK